ncbi:MAG: nucleotidyltransferase family protein [Solirubrobacteraceae bacterium]
MSATVRLADGLHVSDRTLRRAVSRGLLRGVRRSPNKLEISARERNYAQTHWALLQALVRALRTEAGVQIAVLYGSVAKGSDRQGSDIDLAVELRSGAVTSVPALERRLERAIGQKVHVVRIADALVDGRFALEIIDHGRPLVDRADRWLALRRRRSSLARLACIQAAERERQIADAWSRFAQAA